MDSSPADRGGTPFCSQFEQVTVELGDRSYPILIGPGALGALPRLAGREASACLVVSDQEVAGRYAEPLLQALRAAGWQAHLATVPVGEGSKSLVQVERLYDACVQAGLRRRHPIIALGGGVVGDLAGFVAATYLRGVPLIQAPTTLLAQIDAAIGGKVGINHPLGKNLIGAFHQPRLVVMDTLTLLSLPEREYRSGLAELVKYGAVLDARLFETLEREVERIRARDLPLLKQLVAWSCRLKAGIVREDERERPGGRRMLLNFGHTIGHALEAVAGFGEMRHGEAVAIGMALAGGLAQRWCDFPARERERLVALLDALGLPTRPPDLDMAQVLAAMHRDKKNQDQDLHLVLPRALGEGHLVALPTDAIAPALAPDP